MFGVAARNRQHRCRRCGWSMTPGAWSARRRCGFHPMKSASTPSATISRTGSSSPRWRNVPRNSPRSPGLTTKPTPIVPDEAAVAIGTAGGHSISARIVIGADGRHSLCRDAAGIGIRHRDLDQAALTFNLSHSRPHRNASTEFHTPHGPCVFVPLPGDRSSVVWVAKPGDAARLKALSDDDLSAAAERQSHSIFGRVHVEPGGICFRSRSNGPCNSRAIVSHWSARPRMSSRRSARRASISDCAMPPISPGCVREAMACGDDPGSPLLLRRYASARRPDILSREMVIDVANRSLLSDFLPMQSLRAAGMHLIGSVGPLRRLAMREGLSPGWRSRQRADRRSRGNAEPAASARLRHCDKARQDHAIASSGICGTSPARCNVLICRRATIAAKARDRLDVVARSPPQNTGTMR